MQKMQKICKNMQKYAQYAKNMQKICRGPNQCAANSICKICKKNMQKICKKYAVYSTNMQNMYQELCSWPRMAGRCPGGPGPITRMLPLRDWNEATSSIVMNYGLNGLHHSWSTCLAPRQGPSPGPGQRQQQQPELQRLWYIKRLWRLGGCCPGAEPASVDYCPISHLRVRPGSSWPPAAPCPAALRRSRHAPAGRVHLNQKKFRAHGHFSRQSLDFNQDFNQSSWPWFQSIKLAHRPGPGRKPLQPLQQLRSISRLQRGAEREIE